jgi:hypothetical protein
LAYDYNSLSFIQITKHWSNNEKAEMILEKLQLIATTFAAPHFKVRWLEFWNSSFHSHQAIHFPLKGFIDKDLKAWLNNSSFWARISNQSFQII